LPALIERVGDHHFGEAGLGIVRLVTVTIHVAIVAPGQREYIMHILNAHLTRPLVMRNTAHYIGAQAQRLLQQRLPIGEREDAILRECPQLELTDIAYLLTHLQERPQCREAGVTHIYMRADIECPLCHGPRDRLQRSPLHIRAAEARLALAP